MFSQYQLFQVFAGDEERLACAFFKIDVIMLLWWEAIQNTVSKQQLQQILRD